jgi:hypothetical protein
MVNMKLTDDGRTADTADSSVHLKNDISIYGLYKLVSLTGSIISTVSLQRDLTVVSRVVSLLFLDSIIFVLSITLSRLYRDLICVIDSIFVSRSDYRRFGTRIVNQTPVLSISGFTRFTSTTLRVHRSSSMFHHRPFAERELWHRSQTGKSQMMASGFATPLAISRFLVGR